MKRKTTTKARMVDVEWPYCGSDRMVGHMGGPRTLRRLCPKKAYGQLNGISYCYYHYLEALEVKEYPEPC